MVSKSEVVRRAWPLCEDSQISAVVDEWRDYPNKFFDGMPAGCNPACVIYNKIHSSSINPEIDVIKRRLCLVQYHLLRLKFKKDFFGPGKSDPLRVFLQTHMSELEEEQASVRQNCDLCATAGQKYHDLAMAHHPGVLFLLATLDPIRSVTHIFFFLLGPMILIVRGQAESRWVQSYNPHSYFRAHSRYRRVAKVHSRYQRDAKV